MTTKVLCAVSGFAVCATASGQDRPELQKAPFSGEVHHAIRATAITGLTLDGSYVYGRTIELGEGNAARGGLVVAYDAAQMADTDGSGCIGFAPVCADLAPHTFPSQSDRFFFGGNFSWQSYAEDIVPAPGSEGGIVSELAFAGFTALCDGGTGTQSDVLQVVFESWEGFDNFPDLDGSDGFDTDGDGLGFPASFSDTDGDTIIDEFLGGVILTYANTDTDGDTLPDEFTSNGAGGYGIFTATGLETFGIPLTSNLDLWDGGKPGTDGRGDGGMRLLWTRGDGGDGLGPLNGFYPSQKAQNMLWGTYAMQGGPGACGYTCDNFGAGDSDGTIWGEGEDVCGDGGGCWSCGAPSGNEVVDNQYDVNFDIDDFFGLVQDFNELGVMFRIQVVGQATQDCCDANADGLCTPADFSAWIAEFNSGGPRCDVNQDGNCTPADFSAWIAAFNASNAGNPQVCIF